MATNASLGMDKPRKSDSFWRKSFPRRNAPLPRAKPVEASHGVLDGPDASCWTACLQAVGEIQLGAALSNPPTIVPRTVESCQCLELCLCEEKTSGM